MTFTCLQCSYQTDNLPLYSEHVAAEHSNYDSVYRVVDFHRATGQPHDKQPHVPTAPEATETEELELDTLSRDLATWAERLKERGGGLSSTRMLRARLMVEELGEVVDAMIDGELHEVLKELCALQYVLDGTFVAFGMEHLKDGAFQEIHRSNMSKAHPSTKEADGKGDNFSPARIDRMLRYLTCR